MAKRHRTHPQGLTVWMLLVLFTMYGCTGSVNAPVDGVGQEGNQPTGAPAASPRSDGATLLFSPYSPERPNASAQNAAFSPDGDQIVFTLFTNGYNRGPAELWVVDLDGSDPQPITPAADQDNVNVPGGAWNSVNDEIVFASDRDEADDIWAIRPDGSGLRRITRHAAPPFWIEPVWSPDGEWIVFEADAAAATELDQRGTIFKVRSDGTELTRLTKPNGEDYDDRLPNWSPDGGRILFQRRDPSLGEGDNWDIFVIDTKGDNLTNVSNAAAFFNTDNSWSPDGRWIASSSQFPVGEQQLPLPNIVAFAVPDPDSAEAPFPPVRITTSSGHEDGAPSVSPDGQWVAFESHRTADEQSPADIWMIPTPQQLR